jgi:hypothetical protein
MKRHQQSSAPRRVVTFTHSVGNRRRIIAANEPTRGLGWHRLVLAAVAAVLSIVLLSIFSRAMNAQTSLRD